LQAWALGAFEGSPTGVPGRRVLNIRQQILDEPPAALVGNVVGKGRDAGAGRTAHSCQGPRGPTFPELLSWYAASAGNVVGKGRDAGAGRTAHSCQGPRGPTFPELLSWYAALVGNVVGKGRGAGAGRTAHGCRHLGLPLFLSCVLVPGVGGQRRRKRSRCRCRPHGKWLPGPRGPTFPELLSWHAASVGNVVGKGRGAGAGRTANGCQGPGLPLFLSCCPGTRRRWATSSEKVAMQVPAVRLPRPHPASSRCCRVDTHTQSTANLPTHEPRRTAEGRNARGRRVRQSARSGRNRGPGCRRRRPLSAPAPHPTTGRAGSR